MLAPMVGKSEKQIINPIFAFQSSVISIKNIKKNPDEKIQTKI